MKKFALHIFALLVLISTLLFVCDLTYTRIYTNCHPRNKLQYILQLKNEQFDAVFLGSSRVANHIDVELFSQLSHKKAINLGVEGAGLNDNLLQLQLLLAQNKVKQLYLQVDSNLESTGPSNISQAEAMPFIKNKLVKEHTQKYFTGFDQLYYIPFYRYAVNDAKIGFRELFFSAFNKKPAIDPAIGYTPKYGNSIPAGKSTTMEAKGLVAKNPILTHIKNLCQQNHTELVLFMTPICSKIDVKPYVCKLKEMEPKLIDLTQGFDDSLFYNCGHLNDSGAKILTRRLYEATKK